MNKDFTSFPELATPRLILRDLRRQDAEEILTLRSDDRVNQFIGRPLDVTLDNAYSFIDRIRHGTYSNHWLYWALIPKPSGRLIGTACLWNFDESEGSGELGYELLPDFQGQGFMVEAVKEILAFGFMELELKMIRALTHRENERSVHLLERNHFRVYEDHRAEEDETAFRLFRRDWLSRQ